MSVQERLDGILLRSLHDDLTQHFKSIQRTFEKQLQAATDAVVALARDSTASSSPAHASAQLSVAIERLHKIRNAFAEASKHEQAMVSQLSHRIEFVKRAEACTQPLVQPCASSLCSADPSLPLTHHQRLLRLVVDYLLRRGYYESASLLTSAVGIEHFVETPLFHTSAHIIHALRDQDPQPALRWCQRNHSRLKKLGSTFEFQVRLRQFYALVGAGESMDALLVAREHLAPHASRPSLLQAVQAAMGALAFPVDSPQTKHQFARERWHELVEAFSAEMFRLHSLPTGSVLCTFLQAGLAALRVNACSEQQSRQLSCPTCNAPLSILAMRVPSADRLTSRLICPISGTSMHGDNYPMALPNGHVYGVKALEEMNERGGHVTCTATGADLALSECPKLFVV
eukprot:TRINITY_DN10978_c0_g1_i1.p1 TRINITY_DN10978_c0_g1~~TRINITY_DN10978_c0_g1_i1.p1  ORF type:complete len:400 (-),score=92.75 TRINITY_DN10978_c0_g1_i1:576-1775(-)